MDLFNPEYPWNLRIILEHICGQRVQDLFILIADIFEL